jgi:O-antigen/teichoic acid export membrane protein
MTSTIGAVENPGAACASRAAWRSAQAARSAAAAVAATAIVFGVRFLTVPLSMEIAGPAGYGLWLTVGSLVAWAGLADLGLGSGLIHRVATACAVSDWFTARRYVSTAMITFAMLALPLAAGVIWIGRRPGLASALGLAQRPGLARHAAALVLIGGLAFVASFGLSWAGALCAAVQEGYRASIASAAAGIATLACLLLIRHRAVTLEGFALANTMPPLACAALLAAGLMAGRHGRIARPSIALWSLGSARSIMGQGTPLFLVQLSDLAILNTANFFIARFAGLTEVARYAVSFSLFATVARVCYAIASAYWPAYSDAYAQRDWAWLRAAAWRNVALSAGLMVVAGTGIVLTGRAFVTWWAGPAATPPASLLAALALYSLIAACSTSVGALLNGLGLTRVRAWLRLFVGAAHVAGGWLLLPRLGLVAFPIAGGAGYLLDLVVSAMYARNHIRSMMALSVTPLWKF